MSGEDTKPAARRSSPGLRAIDSKRVDALRHVPNVRAVTRLGPSAWEALGAGDAITLASVDDVFHDLEVLLRYGHRAQVGEIVDELLRTRRGDLAILRRVIELHVAAGQDRSAIDALILLASRFIERRNLEGVRAVAAQILEIDGAHPRAQRLLALTDESTS